MRSWQAPSNYWKSTAQPLIKSAASATALTILRQFVAAKLDLNHRPMAKITQLTKAPCLTLFVPKDHSLNNHKPAIALDHHLYNHLKDCWVQQSSKLQPHITLQVSTTHEDYGSLGFKLPRLPCTIPLSLMADTGCRSIQVTVDACCQQWHSDPRGCYTLLL